jgi:hypothetical protein
MMALLAGFALALLQETTPQGHPEMTAGGWAFMIAAWIFILVLVFYTFSKILGGNR